jgi:predicted RNA-binding protein with PIN domain
MLVDGHSVIHTWPRLRALHQAKPAQAREELCALMARLHDASAWNVTLVFDGRRGGTAPRHKSQLVVHYSSDGESADAVIERTVSANPEPQRILVVTADEMEKRVVEGMGAYTASPEWLAQELQRTEIEFESALKKVRKNAKW